MLTTDEMAQIANVDQYTILRYIKKGQIKILKTCTRYMIPKLYAFKFMISQQFIEQVSNINYIVAFYNGLIEWMEEQIVDCEVAS